MKLISLHKSADAVAYTSSLSRGEKERDKPYQFECCKSVASPVPPWQITRVNPFLSAPCKSPAVHRVSLQRPLNTHFTCSKGRPVNRRGDLELDIFLVGRKKRGEIRPAGDLLVSACMYDNITTYENYTYIYHIQTYTCNSTRKHHRHIVISVHTYV